MMDVLIDPPRYSELYNCSQFPIDTIPLELRRKVVYGIGILGLAVIFLFANLACLCAMCKFLAHSAYKMLLIIGFTDSISLTILAIYGAFLIQGAVFCSTPLFQFWLGMISNFCWAQACTLHLFLAIERCVAQIWPQLAKSLFDGPRIWPWLLFSLLYSLYYGFLWKPAVLSSAIGTTSPDPFSGYRMADEARKGIKYSNDLEHLHAKLFAIALPAVYVLFAILISLKWCKIETQPSNQQMKMRKSIFVQIFAVTIVEFAGCAILVFVRFMPPVMVSLILLYWTLICGLPSMIYLTFNKTLHQESLRQMGLKKVTRSVTGTMRAWT